MSQLFQNIIFNLKQIVHVEANNKEATRALVGAFLIKFSSSGATIWGNVNIYFFSYLKQYDPDLKFMIFSILLAFVAIPLTLLMLFSIQIAQKVGYMRLIRSMMFVYPICVFLASFCTQFYSFMFFYVFSSVIAIGSSSMPVLYCLWSHFPKVGQVTGIVMAGFGLAQVIFNLAATLLINPHNKRADIYQKNQRQQIYYFDSEVGNNVPSAVRYLALAYALFAIPGSWLLTNQGNSTSTNKDIPKHDLMKKAKLPQKKLPKITCDQQEIDSSKLLQERCNQTSNDIELNEISKKKKQQKEQGEGDKVNNNSNFGNCPDVQTGALSQPFLIIYFSSMLVSLFLVFLSLNFQAFGLTQLNDDHLLMYMINANAIIGSISNLVWGHYIDKLSFQFIYRILISGCAVIALTFPWTSEIPFTFFISYCLLGCVEQGVYTIVGPGLVQIFGLNVGTKLFPIQTSSFFLVLVIIPLLQIILFQYLDYDGFIEILAMLIVVAVFLTSNLRNVYSWSSHQKQITK